jgi:hypothetical protein
MEGEDDLKLEARLLDHVEEMSIARPLVLTRLAFDGAPLRMSENIMSSPEIEMSAASDAMQTHPNVHCNPACSRRGEKSEC